MLRDDIVKDESGACAVFTEQGSSASQMTAAKEMDVIASLPDCDGQAADAVSAYTRWRMLPDSSEFQSQNVQIYGYVFHTSGPNHGQTVKILWFFLNEMCMVTDFQASCARHHLKEFYWNWDGRRYRN